MRQQKLTFTFSINVLISFLAFLIPRLAGTTENFTLIQTLPLHMSLALIFNGLRIFFELEKNSNNGETSVRLSMLRGHRFSSNYIE